MNTISNAEIIAIENLKKNINIYVTVSILLKDGSGF